MTAPANTGDKPKAVFERLSHDPTRKLVDPRHGKPALRGSLIRLSRLYPKDTLGCPEDVHRQKTRVIHLLTALFSMIRFSHREELDRARKDYLHELGSKKEFLPQGSIKNIKSLLPPVRYTTWKPSGRETSTHANPVTAHSHHNITASAATLFPYHFHPVTDADEKMQNWAKMGKASPPGRKTVYRLTAPFVPILQFLQDNNYHFDYATDYSLETLPNGDRQAWLGIIGNTHYPHLTIDILSMLTVYILRHGLKPCPRYHAPSLRVSDSVPKVPVLNLGRVRRKHGTKEEKSVTRRLSASIRPGYKPPPLSPVDAHENLKSAYYKSGVLHPDLLTLRPTLDTADRHIAADLFGQHCTYALRHTGKGNSVDTSHDTPVQAADRLDRVLFPATIRFDNTAAMSFSNYRQLKAVNSVTLLDTMTAFFKYHMGKPQAATTISDKPRSFGGHTLQFYDFPVLTEDFMTFIANKHFAHSVYHPRTLDHVNVPAVLDTKEIKKKFPVLKTHMPFLRVNHTWLTNTIDDIHDHPWQSGYLLNIYRDLTLKNLYTLTGAPINQAPTHFSKIPKKAVKKSDESGTEYVLHETHTASLTTHNITDEPLQDTTPAITSGSQHSTPPEPF